MSNLSRTVSSFSLYALTGGTESTRADRAPATSNNNEVLEQNPNNPGSTQIQMPYPVIQYPLPTAAPAGRRSSQNTAGGVPLTQDDHQNNNTQGSSSSTILQQILSGTYERQQRAPRTPRINVDPPTPSPPPTIPILIVVCVSCSNAIRLTNVPIYIHEHLGYHNGITDTLIPTECDTCCKTASCLSERRSGHAVPSCDHYSFINTEMLSGWQTVRTLRTLFGVDFNCQQPRKLVTRQADYWEIIKDGRVGVAGVRVTPYIDVSRMSARLRENQSSDYFFGRPWDAMGNRA